MLQTTTQPAPIGHNKAPDLCTCPGCGAEFEKGGRGLGKTFCADTCRRAFHAAAKSEGGPLAPMIKAWHATRHAKPGSREAEICRYARGQITEMARMFIEADGEIGRDAVAYVESLMTSGFQFADRTKR